MSSMMVLTSCTDQQGQRQPNDAQLILQQHYQYQVTNLAFLACAVGTDLKMLQRRMRTGVSQRIMRAHRRSRRHHRHYSCWH